MEKEKKWKQPPADATAPPGDDGEGSSERKGKKAMKEKAEAILPSQQIKNKDKRREVHAKLKREKKAQKRGQAARRTEELVDLDPKLKRALTSIYELCRYTAEQSHAQRCDLHEMKTHLNIASVPPPPLPTFPDPFEESEVDDYEDDGNGVIDYDSEE